VLTGIGCAMIVALGYFRWHSATLQNYDYELECVGVGFLLVGATMFAEWQLVNKMLSIKPLQWLAGIGLTVLVVQEPIELQLEQWNLLYFQNKLAFWISVVGFIMAASLVAWLALRFVEEPAYRVRRLLRDLRKRQVSGEKRRTGPAPRRLPDLVLQLPTGGAVPLREMVGSLPLLVALGDEGKSRLAEQRFRLDADEADSLYVAAESNRAERGRTVLLDPERRLAKALGVPAVLLEVAPDGLITALHEPELALA